MWIRSELTPLVTGVKINRALKSFPALVSSPMTQAMRQQYAVMHPEAQQSLSENLTMEINPSHAIIVGLNRLRKSQPSLAQKGLRQLHETCMLSVGIPFNVQQFVQRCFSYLEGEISNKAEESKEE